MNTYKARLLYDKRSDSPEQEYNKCHSQISILFMEDVLLTIFIQFNPVPTPGVQSMWVLCLWPAY